MGPWLSRHSLAALLAATSLFSSPLHAQPAPMLHGRSFDGHAVDLTALRGRVVIVTFWSTACAVCRDRLPELRANAQGWLDKPFEMVLVSVDKRREDWAAYEDVLAATRLRAPNTVSLWRSEPGHRDSFGAVTHVPTTLVIDRQGRVVKTIQGRLDPSVWDDVAELLLN